MQTWVLLAVPLAILAATRPAGTLFHAHVKRQQHRRSDPTLPFDPSTSSSDPSVDPSSASADPADPSSPVLSGVAQYWRDRASLRGGGPTLATHAWKGGYWAADLAVFSVGFVPTSKADAAAYAYRARKRAKAKANDKANAKGKGKGKGKGGGTGTKGKKSGSKGKRKGTSSDGKPGSKRKGTPNTVDEQPLPSGTYYVGTLTGWWAVPLWVGWSRRGDLFIINALHMAAALLSTLRPLDFYWNFIPRLRRPHTVLLGAFATSSIFECVWVASSVMMFGGALQGGDGGGGGTGGGGPLVMGREGFAALYLVSGLLASFVGGVILGERVPGHGGVLAAITMHTLLNNAHGSQQQQHRVVWLGQEMSAGPFLCTQLGMACLGAFQAGKPRTNWVNVGLVTMLPMVVGAAWWWAVFR